MIKIGDTLPNVTFARLTDNGPVNLTTAEVFKGEKVLLFAVPGAFTPLGSLASRKHEYEADHFAAQKSSANALISALVKLYQDNASTLTPDPIYTAFYSSHPPAPLRIAHLQRFA